MSATSSQDGFSTVEVLVAMAILSLGLALAVQTIAQARGNVDRLEKRTSANEAVRRIIDDNLPALLANATSGSAEKVGPGWTIEVRPIANASDIHLARLSVQLSKDRSQDVEHFETVIMLPGSGGP